MRICLSRVKKERAMLIKDSDGDWGVCIASWAGLQKGIPGVPGMEKTCLNFFEAMCLNFFEAMCFNFFEAMCFNFFEAMCFNFLEAICLTFVRQ